MGTTLHRHSIAMYPGVQRAILRVAVFLVISGSCVIVDNDHSVTPIPQEEFVTTTIDFQGSDEIVPEGTEGDLLMAASSQSKNSGATYTKLFDYECTGGTETRLCQGTGYSDGVASGHSVETTQCSVSDCAKKAKAIGVDYFSISPAGRCYAETKCDKSSSSSYSGYRIVKGTRRVPKARNTMSSAVAQYKKNQALNSAANKSKQAMAAPSGTRRVPKARNTISSAVAQYKKNQALNSAANQAAPSGTRRVPKGKSSGTQAVSTGRSKGKSSGTQAVSTGPSKGKSRR